MSDLPAVDYRLVLRQAPDLYLILSPDLKIIDASDAYLKATMVKRENIIGHDLFEIFPDNPNDTTATGVHNLNASLLKVLKNKRLHHMEIQKYDIRRPIGEFEEHYWRPLNSPVLDEKDHIQCIIHRVEDVTEIALLKDVALAKTQRLNLMIEHIRDYAIIMLDKEGCIESSNVGVERNTGYKTEELIGRHFSIFYPLTADRFQNTANMLETAKQFGRAESEGWRLRKDGTQYWAHTIMMPIFDSQGVLMGYGKITQDLTNQKKVEQLKNEFISIVNHELRTPLTSVVGAIRILLNGITQTSPEKTKQLLEIADSNCQRLMQLINDILDIEKIEADKLNLNIQSYEINQLIIEAIHLNKLYSDHYGIQIEFEDDQVSLTAETDKDRLMQVLTNLISNAVKFASKNSVVHIRLKQRGLKIRIEVANHGVGIPEHFKSKVFEKFSQANYSLNRQETGTGLGLAISKAIVEQLGGTLEFTSEPDKETVFYFELPFRKESKS